jgi:hypothetical protein
MDGIQNAKACGVMFGRGKHLTPSQITELQERRQQGVLIRTLMHDYRISVLSLNYLDGRVQTVETDVRFLAPALGRLPAHDRITVQRWSKHGRSSLPPSRV